MADLRMSELGEAAGLEAEDLLLIVDASDTSMAATGTNKKLTLGAFDARWDTGDAQQLFAATVGQDISVTRGTASGPDENPHPSLKVSRYSSLTTALAGAGSAPEQMAAIYGIHVADEDSTKQPIGVLGVAKTSATADPDATSDALGVQGYARMLPGSVGAGYGGYFVTRLDSGADADASATGIELQIHNFSGNDHDYDPDGFAGSMCMSVLTNTNASANRVGVGIQILRPSATGPQFDVGIGFPADTPGVGGGVLTASIRDDGAAVTSIDINGSRTTGIDLVGATCSGAGIALGANSISAGTTTGAKIGTATSQKLGFWNATPVVQPTAVADATDATTVITQLNALLAKLRTIGLIAA